MCVAQSDEAKCGDEIDIAAILANKIVSSI